MKTLFSGFITMAFLGLCACAPSASDVKKALGPAVPANTPENQLLTKVKNQDVRVRVGDEEFTLGVGYATIIKYMDGAERLDIDLSKASVVNCQKSFEFENGGQVNFNFPINKTVVSGFDFSVQLSAFKTIDTKYISGDKVIKIEKVDSQEVQGSVYVKDADGNEINGHFKAHLCKNDL